MKKVLQLRFSDFIFGVLIIFAQALVAQSIPQQSRQLASQIIDVEQKNKIGQVHYAGVAIKMAQEAAEKFAHGGECAASCPEGCCESSSGLVYEGGMFMLLNTQATLKSKEHNLIAKESCAIHNRYATTPRDCTKEIKAFEYTKPESNWYDDQGKCKSSSPPECKLISLIPGSGIFNSPQVNCKKNTSKPCGIDFYMTYKSNPDGSISIRTANKMVKLSIESFKDKDSLVAAGIPFTQADSLLAQFKVASAKSFPNGKAAYVALNREQIKEELNKGINPSEIMNSDQLSRQPSSYQQESIEEVAQNGLTKNFNGELIHAKSSNIFEVMSKRYQKTTESLLP